MKKHMSSEPAPDSCICKTHQTEAKRMWANPEFVPKWKIKDTSPEITSCTSCIFPECQEIIKLISPKFYSLEIMS